MLGVLALLAVTIVAFLAWRKMPRPPRLAHLPAQFVIFDLETTGLDPEKHEIIEIGAIRVNRDSDEHDGFQALVRPQRRVPAKITSLTGITQEMLDADGESLESAIRQFHEFVGGLNLVAFNAEFDLAFLRRAASQHGIVISNPVACALKMARRAWPGRKSYRLADLARDGNLSATQSHRALADCQLALIVYTAAASHLGVSD